MLYHNIRVLESRSAMEGIRDSKKLNMTVMLNSANQIDKCAQVKFGKFDVLKLIQLIKRTLRIQ